MKEKQLIGWREWVALPELSIPAIKAKVDTGARTSSLHAVDLTSYMVGDIKRVRFGVQPLPDNETLTIYCNADVLDERVITNSGGTRELRFVIGTTVRFQDSIWPVKITLTERQGMGFRMLLGRTALRGRYVVDVAKRYVGGKQLSRSYDQRTEVPK